jgi:hypothetical protein
VWKVAAPNVRTNMTTESILDMKYLMRSRDWTSAGNN